MRINARRTFWGLQKKSVNELVVYLNLKNNQKISKSKHKLVEMKSENIWLQEQFDLLNKSALKNFSPEQKSAFIERLNKIEKSALPTKQTDDFMPNLKKTLFGLHPEKVKAHIKQLKMYQSNELKEVNEQLDRLISQRNALLDEIRLYWENFEEEKSVKQSPSEEQQTEPEQKQGVQGESVKEIVQQVTPQSTRISGTQSAQLNQPTVQIADEQHVRHGQRVQHEQHEQQDQPIPHVPVQNLRLIKQQAPVSNSKPKRLTMEVSSFWEEDIEVFLAGFSTASTIESEQSIHSHSGDISQRDGLERSRERLDVGLHQPVGSKKSQAISDQSAHLRRKYIVGKIAGKELKDDRGKLIARQDTEITEQVLITAEQEGKLAELIVNMKLQRLGD